MGGGGNKPINTEYDYNYSQFKNEREKYNKRHEILQKLPQEKQDEILESEDPSLNGINTLYNKIKDSITNKMISESEIKIAIREVMVGQALMNANILTEYNIQEHIKTKIQQYLDMLLKKYGSQTFTDIINIVFTNDYPNIQKAILNYSNPKKIFDDDLTDSCYYNLKYNRAFLVNCLIFLIDNLQICDLNHCQKLSEIIACNLNLKTLVLGFFSDIAHKKEIKEFNQVFQAIKYNFFIRSLIVIAENSQNELKLTSEIENYIVDIIKKSNIKNFILGNFIISSTFLTNLSNAISTSESLKTFVFYKNSKDNISKNEIDTFIRKILRNKFIRLVIFGGSEITNEEIEEYDKLKVQSSNLKVFEFVNDFKIEINHP